MNLDEYAETKKQKPDDTTVAGWMALHPKVFAAACEGYKKGHSGPMIYEWLVDHHDYPFKSSTPLYRVLKKS